MKTETKPKPKENPPQEIFDTPEAEKAMRDHARRQTERLAALKADPDSFKLRNTHAVEFLDSLADDIRRRMEADK